MVQSDGSSLHTRAFPVLALFGFVAPFLTFAIAVSDWPFEIKMAVLITLAAVYLAICVWAFRKITELSPVNASKPGSDPLAALDDANQFFGASLKRGDMFRLVSERLGLIVPISATALFLSDGPASEPLMVEQLGLAAGPIDTAYPDGLAAMTFLSGEIELDTSLGLERSVFGDRLPEDVRAAAAIPLVHDRSVFAVFEVFLRDPIDDENALRGTMESIAHRIAPLFLGSIAIERVSAGSFIDQMTSLPNERAFAMVLEHQLAESLRQRNDRPLSVLAIEASSRTPAEQHDVILKKIADGLREQMRAMDFLARSNGDEFLAILPATGEQAAEKIVERIRSYFRDNELDHNGEPRRIELNIGTATFWQDGDTPAQLKQTALFRKEQEKAQDPAAIALSRKEYVN